LGQDFLQPGVHALIMGASPVNAVALRADVKALIVELCLGFEPVLNVFFGHGL
jgi:hypothetical protein